MSPDQMPKCRDCRWWAPTSTKTRGMCLRLIPPRGRIEGGDPPEGMAEPTGQATLITAPTFGCVQFTVKT